MDQDHRPWIHRTYTESVRLVTGQEFQMGITKLRIFGIPLFILVTDMRVAPNAYYQGFTLFNFIYVHTTTVCKPGLHRGDWYIVSHPIFKPLHYLLDRRFKKMNEVQNGEDDPVRNRRGALRGRGFGFVHEDPDFITANLKTNNVVFPKIRGELRYSLKDIPVGVPTEKSQDAIDLLIRKDSGDEFTVWPGVCPHEGGPLKAGKSCGAREIQCPWHGLRFAGLKLHPAQLTGKIGHFSLRLDSPREELVLSNLGEEK
jgi:hypothetical protein